MKKKILIIISSILAAVVLIIGVTATALYAPRSMKEIFNNEGIVSITLVYKWENEREVSLSEDKFDEFISIAKSGKYVKRYNWLKH